MGMLRDCAQEKRGLFNILRYFRYKARFYSNNPGFFHPDGLLCFVGPQGSGKSLSAVNYIYRLLKEYPLSKLCTNLQLTDYPIVSFEEFKKMHNDLIIQLNSEKKNAAIINKIMWEKYVTENRVFIFKDNDDFTKYNNGSHGMIYFVDEIQLYLSSLENKNVNMDVLTQIAQQRKQRKHIVATCQVFGRMAKALREQFSNVVLCKNYLGFIQVNKLIDRDSLDKDSSSDTQITGKVKQKFVWFHNPEMYRRYDTYYLIERGRFVSGEKQQKEGVYNDNDIRLSSNH